MVHVGRVFCLGYLLSAVLVAGCATPMSSSARLYNLENGRVVILHLHSFSNGRGKLSAILPDGEEANGEYHISAKDLAPVVLSRPAVGEDHSGVELEEKSSAVRDQKAMRSWPEVYGYGPNSNVGPIGTGIVVGNRGTVLEIVLYSANLRDGDGDGVGRDNKGNWYRVQIGELK